MDEAVGEIVPGIFLGNVRSLNALETFSITHVLSAINFEPPKDLSAYTTLRINIADDEGENLLMHLPTSYSFISEALAQGGKVLVHCQGGVSRSASLVAAYLMKTRSLGAEEAIELIRQKWPNASPNEGFEAQLGLFQDMKCSLDEDHPVYRMWCLGRVGELWESNGWVDPDTFATVPADPSTAKCIIYRCRKCRLTLATESHVITVDSTTLGHRVFYRDRRYGRFQVEDGIADKYAKGADGQLGASLFLEPVAWMADSVLSAVQGKLHCPGCNARMGSFNWSGISDENAAWITPAFQIHTSKVDIVRPVAPIPSPRQLATPMRQQPPSAPPSANATPSVTTATAPPSASAALREASSETMQQLAGSSGSCQMTHLILDCDGVMVDSERASCEALRLSVLKVTDFDIPHDFPTDYYPVFGMDVLSCVEYYAQRFELGEAQGWGDCAALAVTVSDTKEGIYQELTESGIQAFDGTKQLVGRARGLGLGVGIASSGSPTKIKHNLTASGLYGLVEDEYTVSAKVVARGKPAPDVYIETMRRLGVERPECVVVVEDAVNGLKAAKGAGALAIGITNSLPRASLEPYADLVVDHLDEIDFTTLRPTIKQA